MRLNSLCALCAVVTFSILCKSKLTQAELDKNQRSPLVQTESAAVVGKIIETLPQGKSAHECLAIPFAEPPVTISFCFTYCTCLCKITRKDNMVLFVLL